MENDRLFAGFALASIWNAPFAQTEGLTSETRGENNVSVKQEDNKTIYDFSLTKGDGKELNLADYHGKAVLIVNTATGCGFTPQYEPIEKLYLDYHEKGLEILDIPCNQFGGQAPGTDEEIHEFCVVHFNTTFPQMKKSDVNGENELPLYTWLKAQKGFEGFDERPFKKLLENMFVKADPDWAKKSDIKWNFTKFVVDREGNGVKRFEPAADMKKVEQCVKDLLQAIFVVETFVD